MILFPNAKINLGLYVTEKRPDGYHNLETLFYPVGWRDILEIVPAKGTESTLTVTGHAVDCPPEKNLVMKAYRRLNEEVPLPPVDIYLHKIIPDGAGLGGGSSDAAFTLRGLNEMFSLELDNERLAEIARSIGADCPFFIYNRPLLATGIGDCFSECDINLDDYAIVIVKPQESVSTKEAYAGVKPCAPTHNLRESLKADTATWRDCIFNDFEKSILPNHPAISKIKEELYAAGAVYAAMSGSGAAVFGIFRGGGDRMSECVKRKFGHFGIYIGRLSLPD